MRADSVELPAVDWKQGPEQTGRAPVEAKRKQQGKDTEKEKGFRFEGYGGHCGEGEDRQEDCWSRQLYRVETDTAEPRMWILRPSRHRCQWRH